jgi:hypothetical protein
MSELPDIVDQYLDMMRLSPERLVWVLVDLQGTVTRWGGDQALLRGRRILVGEPAAEQLVGLTGIVPVGQSSVVISNFEIEPGVVVNLHAIPSPVGGCLLLLDAAAEHEAKQKKQQKRYDEKLATRTRQRRK